MGPSKAHLLQLFWLLLLSACLPTVHRLPPPPLDPTHALPAPLQSIELRLAQPSSLEVRYELVSAAVQLARHAQHERWLDPWLEQQAERILPEPLGHLFLFWWADNAVLRGAWPEALARLERVEHTIRHRPRADRTQLLLMEQPLLEYIHERRSMVLERMGQLEAAYRLLASHPVQSVALRSSLLPRQYRLARMLLKQRQPLPLPISGLEAPMVFPPRREGPRLPVRSLESLQLLAPWQAGVAQRAGVLAEHPGRSVSRALTYGFSAESRACGLWRGGYYYGAGTHARERHAGRDVYTVDFTAAPGFKHAYGRGSYGIELRASATGLVWQASYLTPTHEGARSLRTQPENNRVDLFHVDWAHFRLAWVIDEHNVGGPIRESLPRPLRLRDAWDYQTSYHHLAGIEGACPAGLQARSFPCIPRPALLSPGLLVWRGSPVGYEDSTGYSFSSHLHFRLSQTCREGGASCSQPLSQQHTGISVPLHLEGQPLTDQTVGKCLRSTNSSPFEGWTGAEPLPLVLSSPPAVSPPPAR